MLVLVEDKKAKDAAQKAMEDVLTRLWTHNGATAV